MNHSEIIHGHARIQCSLFGQDTSVTECFAMIHVSDATLPFEQQLESLRAAYSHLLKLFVTPSPSGELEGGCHCVFRRYFLSDASNQQAALMATEIEDPIGEVSVIQQPPLDGTKVALWAYIMTNVKVQALANGLTEVTHGAYRHLWNASMFRYEDNSEYQTRIILNDFIMQLIEAGCSMERNCLRTWFFVNEVDTNYAGMVKARNEVFLVQGMNPRTHYVASTGIGGRQSDPEITVQMDAYAVDGLQPGQVHHLYAPTHLSRTSVYGSAFERGTCVEYGDRRHVFISGTASIGPDGQILYAGDVVRQTARVLENVETLLSEADVSFDDVPYMIVYLRDIADHAIVSQIFRERFPGKPCVFVQASECRPQWLVGMECQAIKAVNNPQFPPF